MDITPATTRGCKAQVHLIFRQTTRNRCGHQLPKKKLIKVIRQENDAQYYTLQKSTSHKQ